MLPGVFVWLLLLLVLGLLKGWWCVCCGADISVQIVRNRLEQRRRSAGSEEKENVHKGPCVVWIELVLPQSERINLD